MAKVDFKVNAITPDGEAVQISPDKVEKARDKGWTIEGVPFRKPDGSPLGEPVVVSPENVPKAREKGWLLEGDVDEGVPESIAAPDSYDMRQDLAANIPAPFAPAEPTPGVEWPLTDQQLAEEAAARGEHVAPRAFTDLDAALADQGRLDRERAEREAAEAAEAAFQKERGIGLSTEQGRTNLLQAAGETAARVPTLGFDAPMAALEAGGQWIADRVPVPSSAALESAGASPFDPSGQPLIERLGQLDEERAGQPIVDARFAAGGGALEPAPAPTFGEEYDAAKIGIAERREANPIFSTVGEIGGNVALGLATGGTSLAARGGSTGLISRLAARTPTGALAKKAAQAGIWAGSKVAVAAEAPGLKGALARIAAPTAALAVEGGAEGTVSGAVQAANQAWLADDYDSVWDLASAGADGALTGLGIGAALGGAIGLGKGVNAARKGAEAGKEMLTDMRLIPEDTSKLADELPVPPEEPTMRYPEPESSTGQSLAQRALKLTPEQNKKLRDSTYSRVRDKVNRFVRLDDELGETLDISAKRRYAIAQGAEVAPTDFHTIREELGFDSAYFNRLLNDGAIKGDSASQRILRRLQKQLEGLEQSQFDASMRGVDDVEIPKWDPDEMNVLPGPGSRQRSTKPMTEGEVYMATDQMKRFVQRARADANDQNLGLLYDELAPVDETLVDYLQSDVAWSPKLAEINRITNPTWSKAITSKMDGQLSGWTLRKGEKLDANAYEYQRQVNDGWLDGHMARAGNPQEEQRALAMQRMLGAASDDALTRARVYGDKEMREAADEMVKLRREIESDLGQITQWNAGTEAVASSPNALGVIAQIPGATYAAEALANKARERAYKATVDSIDKIDRASAMRGLFKNAKPNKALTVAEKLAPTAAANAPDVVNYVERMVAWGPEQQGDQDKAMAEIERVYGPEMSAIHAAKIEAHRQFLLSHAGNPDSPIDRAKLYRYGDAAMRPLKAVDRVAAGLGTPEDRETLQTLYPGLWKRFVDGAIRTMNTRDRDYKDRLKASRAIGIPLDSALEPARLAQLQALAGSNPAETQQQTGGDLLSPSQRRAPDMAGILER